ncbi:primosomal protein N' [Lentibacillus halophilus]|uniref:Replication restart protein PriA n=1 Tax=Lentibacillus halophilus TaxID=295065 RepID=A0ABN0ZEX9_9BACI
MIANVIVDVPASSINQSFDYHIPEHFQGVIQPGMRVIVPFGSRNVMGFVTGLAHESSHNKLKTIAEVLDLTPVLTDELLELGMWLAEDTLSLYITAYQAMLPQVLKANYKKELERLTDASLPNQLESLFAGRLVVPYDELNDAGIGYHHVQKAIRQGDITVHYLVKSRVTKKRITYIKPSRDVHLLEEAYNDLSNRAKKQKELLAYFIQQPEEIKLNSLLKKLGTTRSTVNTLLEKQLLETSQQEIYRNPYDNQVFERTEALKLTDEQEKTMDPIKQDIKEERHDVFLIHGVTGSGKTEIYLQAIQDVIAKGEEAIVLVPEISLTPQMVKRFKGRFGSSVAVMHSALSNGEKYDEWRRIQQKDVQVVVGARSAVFAPFENLGVLIIDEEHENSYKQEDQPRYHARDVAIRRGRHHQCPVILGSATPALESYARAQKGVYQLATLSKRTNNKAMPQMELVDMRHELHAGNRSMFSRSLKNKVEQCISRGEQAVLLLNRRGYSTFVMCRECGHVKECPHCDIALTFHKNSNQLKCHYCSYEEPMPTYCPSCNSELIRFFGTGTQRMEEALVQLIPQARILRMDVDTTRRKGAHERLLNQFANKEADILLGTQMIAKGLDFENVTLVGVLTADSMLHLPDFRSAEKTFQLLTQVSGRAGRHELPGEVIVQTYTPEHYSIELASQYDYVRFYQNEMRVRKTFQYPPFVFLALITVSDENHAAAARAAQQIAKGLWQSVQTETVVLGPTPSPIPRMKDRYRYQCMIKYKNEPNLRSSIHRLIAQFDDQMRKSNLQITVDMQPYQLI